MVATQVDARDRVGGRRARDLSRAIVRKLALVLMGAMVWVAGGGPTPARAEQTRRAGDEAPARPALSLDLRIEMGDFANDLKRSRSYGADALSEALKPMGKGAQVPATAGQMLAAMARVLAAVDGEFDAGWKPLSAGRPQEAIAAWKDLLNAAREEKSYKMALVRYYLAEAYRTSGQTLEAIFEYRSLALFMPDKFSPAAMGRYRAGQCFVELKRYIRAHEEWSAFVAGYASADSELLGQVQDQIKEWSGQYGSLSGIIDNAAGQMKTIRDDLRERGDSGQPVQSKQERVISLLDDLILTLEEKEKEKDCNCSGAGQGQGSGQGPPNGSGMNPATESALVDGKSTLGTLDSTAKTGRDDGWGRLPVREREKIINAIQTQFPERYRELVKEYFKAISGAGVPVEGSAPPAGEPASQPANR